MSGLSISFVNNTVSNSDNFSVIGFVTVHLFRQKIINIKSNEVLKVVGIFFKLFKLQIVV
jgi:hypothetical protein